jgi:hypothetical protein
MAPVSYSIPGIGFGGPLPFFGADSDPVGEFSIYESEPGRVPIIQSGDTA